MQSRFGQKKSKGEQAVGHFAVGTRAQIKRANKKLEWPAAAVKQTILKSSDQLSS